MMIRALLWISGILAAIALFVPGAVVVGMYLLVLPGLALAIAPTLFLYTAAFAVIRRYLPYFKGLKRDSIALLLTAGLGIGLALPMGLLGRSAFELADSGDVMAKAPVVLNGDIALKRSRAYDTPRDACDAVCAALLDTPGVTSVTLVWQDGADTIPAPKTFQLVAKSLATANSLAPNTPERILDFVPKPEKQNPEKRSFNQNWQAEADAAQARRNAVAASWALRLARTQSLITAKTPTKFDQTIEIDEGRETGQHKISVTKIEFRNAQNAAIFRKQHVTAKPILIPLVIWPENLMMDRGFVAARHYLHSEPRYFELKAIETLFAQTNLAQPKISSTSVLDMRDTLAAAYATNKPVALELVVPWIATLKWDNLEKPETDLLGKLITDIRVQEFGRRLYDGAQDKVSPELRAPIITRLLTTATPDALWNNLDDLIRHMPPGTFAEMTADENKLLETQALRVKTEALVERLADRGEKSVPQLVQILQQDLRLPHWRNQWIEKAVQSALIRLGPQAASALPTIEQMYTRSDSPFHGEWRNMQRWQIAMVRMGKPMAELSFSKNNTPAQTAQDRDFIQREVAKAGQPQQET
jgi:hypothetical protein